MATYFKHHQFERKSLFMTTLSVISGLILAICGIDSSNVRILRFSELIKITLFACGYLAKRQEHYQARSQ